MSDRLTTAIARAEADSSDNIALTGEERAYVDIAILTAVRASADDMAQAARNALAAGCTPRGIEDVVVQMAAYVGFASSKSAMSHIKSALKESVPDSVAALPGPEARYQLGSADYGRLDPDALDNIRLAFDEMAHGLINNTFTMFGDLFASSSLDLVVRQLATVGALAALGSAPVQLTFHLGVARKLEISAETPRSVLLP